VKPFSSREGVEFAAAGEMNAGDLVDEIANEIAVDHPVLHAPQDGGDHIAPCVSFLLGLDFEIVQEVEET
jgi:hypothetical protein